jgi:hypothetical protein
MIRRLFNKRPIGQNNKKKSIWGLPSGLFGLDLFNKAYDFFFGKLPYHVQQLIKNKGNLKIVGDVYIARKPIQGIIDTLFNILSMGKFDEAKNNLSYDDLYHLFIIITLEDGTMLRVEKNQDINIAPSPALTNTEFIKVPVEFLNLTLFGSLENTRKLMGDSKFYGYDAFTNNCQDFVLSWLKSNGVLNINPQLESFVKQNAGELLKTTPQYTDIVAKGITTGASYLNRFLSWVSRGRIGFEEGGIVGEFDGC